MYHRSDTKSRTTSSDLIILTLIDLPTILSSSKYGSDLLLVCTTDSYIAFFEIIKKNYERGFWTKQMVRMAVGRVITKEEYQEITGEEY